MVETANVYLLLSNGDYSNPITFVSYVTAIALAWVVIFYSYRFYKVSGFFTLGSIAIGFTFILTSYVLGLLNLSPDLEGNTLLWVRLVILSYGFTFLALSYYHKIKESEGTFHWVIRNCALSIIPVSFLILLLQYILPATVPEYFTLEQMFRIYNLFMLGYICKSALQSSVKHGRMQFMYVPVAYAVLWLGQYTWLLNAIDENYSTFFLGSILKIIGLAILVGMIYNIIKGKRAPDINNKT